MSPQRAASVGKVPKFRVSDGRIPKSTAFRPEGAKTNQPRATPWGWRTTKDLRPERATQSGRICLCVAPTGLRRHRLSPPRALPWAGISLPLRGERQNAQIQQVSEERARGRTPSLTLRVAASLPDAYDFRVQAVTSATVCWNFRRVSRMTNSKFCGPSSNSSPRPMSSFAPRKTPFRGAKGDKIAVLFLDGCLAVNRHPTGRSLNRGKPAGARRREKNDFGARRPRPERQLFPDTAH